MPGGATQPGAKKTSELCNIIAGQHTRDLPANIVLAFDFGTQRIGVAVGQDATGTAQALATVRVHNGRPDWKVLSDVIEQWAPDLLVLGLPATDDGSIHPLAAPIDRFARRLEGRFGIPVSFVDERLSSVVAERDSESQRKGVDAVAARVILESWFSEHFDSPNP